MSPLSLRRHRAERLLREEFDGLRARVLASAGARLRANGVSLDRNDLEACYATAWQGLYAAVLDGQEIANPTGWLVLVTFRRAIEEQRSRARVRCGAELGRGAEDADLAADLAAELDDRVRLRQLFEGLRGRLDGREREAATLCYLQGLSRSEAAARMGIGEARMRKVMEGRGPGRPGVAGKVGALVASIRDGDWCQEQGSLMRALAFGILDTDGERHQLALMHHGQCPACRAYVASLRGLAAALPPVLLPWGVGAAALARATEGAHTGLAAPNGSGGVPAGTGPLAAAGASGAAGGASGGWLVGAGGLGAKLAVGCLLAFDVGVGCVALEAGRLTRPHRPVHGRTAVIGAGAHVAALRQLEGLARSIGHRAASATSADAGSSAALTPSARAGREFGPQALSSGNSTIAHAAGGQVRTADSAPRGARSSSGVAGPSARKAAGGELSRRGEAETEVGDGNVASSSSDSAAAEREFAPG